jgi:hypothetical protein
VIAVLHVLPFVAVMLLLACETRPPASEAQDAPAREQQAPKSAQQVPTSGQQAPARAQPPPVTVQQAPASAAQQAQSRAQKPALCLDLQASRDQVVIGEPFSLIASVVNCSAVDQQVDDLLSPDYGFLQLSIKPPEGKEQLYRPIAKREARGKPTRSLAPGDRLSAFAPVYASADGWTITRPGRYVFRAQYSVDAARLESKPVAVDVATPQSEADRQAASIMVSREVGSFLITGSDQNGEASKRLTAIIEQYPQSRLAPYARVGLAIADSRDRFDPSTKTFRKDGCERTTDQLARAPEISDPSLASAGTAAWIRCLKQLGRDKEVSGAISTFLRSHPAARKVTTLDQALGVTRKE